jgi:hypothetical protein
MMSRKTLITSITLVLVCAMMLTACTVSKHDATNPTINEPTQAPSTTPTENTTTPPTDATDDEQEPTLPGILQDPLDSYVERSNKVRDESAMLELAQMTMLASYTQEIYDEMVSVSVANNVSCYIDKASESQLKIDKTVIEGDNYTYGDDARDDLRSNYYAAGNAYGFTITFKPVIVDGRVVHYLGNGIINMFNGGTTTLSDLPKLYEKLRGCCTRDDSGEAIVEIASQAYQNSDYTIFVYVRPDISNDSEQYVVTFGQFNGAYLDCVDAEVRVADK